MKILILGANGNLGSIFFKYLIKNSNYKIITTSTGEIKYASKFHKKINLKNNLNKIFNIISNEKFNVIINCLFIRNENQEYDTEISKKIITYIKRKNYQNITWIETSSYSISRKYKTKYIYTKIKFENFLRLNYRNNLSKLKIIRIGNFLNNHMINKLSFLSTKNYQFIISNKKNVIYVTDHQIIKYFFKHSLDNRKIDFNLVKKISLDNIFNMINKNGKKIIFLNVNEKIIVFLKYFLNHKYKNKLFNLLNLFYSK